MNSDGPDGAGSARGFLKSGDAIGDIAVVADGQECTLSQGDVITRLTDSPDQDQNVNASVAASKKSDCAAGATVAR